MKTAKENAIMRELGEKTAELLKAAGYEAALEQYDEKAEILIFQVNSWLYRVNVVLDSPGAAIIDIAKQLLSKRFD